jgi:hypothetical protein
LCQQLPQALMPFQAAWSAKECFHPHRLAFGNFRAVFSIGKAKQSARFCARKVSLLFSEPMHLFVA